MKMQVKYIIICAVFFVISGCVTDPDLAETGNNNVSQTRAQTEDTRKYYYGCGEKIYLDEVPDKIVVRYNKSRSYDINQLMTKSSLSQYAKYDRNEEVVVLPTGKSGANTLAVDLKRMTGIKSINPVYKLADFESSEMYLTDEFMLKWKEGVSKQQIDEMHKKFNVKHIKTTKIYQLFSVPANVNVLDVANAYQESGLVVFSQPDFRVKIVPTQVLPSDPYFSNQYYLHNTGQLINGRTSTAGADINAPQAWGITKGSSFITIAVLDSGVSANHPDLPADRQIRLPGSDFVDGDGDPSPTDNAHGTGCAGIIAASHNNEGVAGIAPNCKVMPVRIPIDNDVNLVPAPLSNTADAIEFAVDNGADIISNSWGVEGLKMPNYHTGIVQAIYYANTRGRGGKGCVVVFGAGNTANHVTGNNGYVQFPANVDISGVITVGASDRNDMQAVYSPTSNLNSPYNQIIDVVAPSRKAYSSQIPTEDHDVWTLDIPGEAGYNPVKSTNGTVLSYLPASGAHYNAYTGHHGGTSAACPQVAGVAALLLSVNSNLTQQEVANIIESTARKARPSTYNYRTTSRLYNGTWSNEMGYGVVDAYAALLAVTGGSQAIFSNRTVYGNTFFGGNGNVIWASNVTVRSGASLTLQAPVVTINEPFTVEAGASLTLTP